MDWLALVSEHTFYEFALIFLFASLLGLLGQFLRQPLIVMFIALGVIVGPAVLDIVKSKDNINLLAEIGISILLFIVGLKLDFRIIKSVGKIALLTGLGQVFFTSLFGYFIGIALGYEPLHSFYIAVALTFSSTIIIVKLLSDKKEIDSLHGQIAIGFLIVQDIVVILVMIVLSAMRQQVETSLSTEVIKTVGTAVFLLFITWVMMKLILPKISVFLAKSQELLTLFAIAWSVSLAAFSEIMGFSGEVGAFLAGVSLASSEFKDVISSRLVSLRDFLLLFFFVKLGSTLNLDSMGSQIPSSIIFSVFVLIGNPIIVLIIMGAMGYKKRTSFLAGLTVAQISEFSLIFAGLGLAVGHINDDIVGLITLVGLITIGLSTYLILYSYPIYELISPMLNIFQRKNPFRENNIEILEDKKFDIVVIGLGRFGIRILKKLKDYKNLQTLGIDFDPHITKELKSDGYDVVYGDIEDVELLDQINYENSKCIIVTVPEIGNNYHIIKKLRDNNYTGKIFVTVRNDKNYENILNLGADKVLLPYEMAASNFCNIFLEDVMN